MNKLCVLFFAVLAAFVFMGCSDDTSNAVVDTTGPTVLSTSAVTDVAINSTITATFSEAMNVATIIASNFSIVHGSTPVLGTVTYDSPNKKIVFAPSALLSSSTTYTATITTAVKDLEGNMMVANKVWYFTTAAAGQGPDPVSLGSAANYVILAKSAISTVPNSTITGDIGLSPAAESLMTGFSQTKATGYSTSTQVVGFMYAADMTSPTPIYLTTAVSDMEAAYTDAAGRQDASFTNLGTGNIGGLNLAPGLYTWDGGVTIPANVTISGGANDVWIFQINGNLDLSVNFSIILDGGAQAKNIFWQVAGTVSMGAGSHFEGIVLGSTSITMGTAAIINGRLYAQTLVALEQAVVNTPAE